MIVKEMVRFPNETFVGEMDLDMGKFKPTNEFKTEIFGWYDDDYISIIKNENKDTRQPTSHPVQ